MRYFRLTRYRAVLDFAALSNRRPGKTSKDPKTGEEVAGILQKARIQGVVMNACESANTRHTSGNANLATTFLRYGISFVVAAAAVLLETTAERVCSRVSSRTVHET